MSQKKKNKSKEIRSENKKKIFLQDVKVGTKIALGYGILTAIIIIAAVTSIYYFRQIGYQNEILGMVTESNDYMQKARLAHMQYDSDKTDENVDLVIENLDASMASIVEAKSKMKTPAMIEGATAFEEELESFKTEFYSYREIDKKKADQTRLQLSLASSTTLDIGRALDAAQFNISLGDDPEKK